MTTITISVDTEVETLFRKTAKEAYDGKKGFLGDAITEAMKKWLQERKDAKIAKRQLELMHRGFHTGPVTYKNRDELHAR